jgi:hypothetical protein
VARDMNRDDVTSESGSLSSGYSRLARAGRPSTARASRKRPRSRTMVRSEKGKEKGTTPSDVVVVLEDGDKDGWS